MYKYKRGWRCGFSWGVWWLQRVYLQTKWCIFCCFFANGIDIKDALEKGKISLKDMTEHLELVNTENNTKIYEFENYQIIFSQDICVIAPLSIEGEDVIQTVEDYISE